VGQVPPEGSDGMPADRDDPFLVALAHAADEPVLEVDAAPLEPDRLADAQARAVEELDERMIPPGPRSRPVGGRNQALDLSRRERPRQLPAAAREIHVRSRIVRPHAEERQMAIERARGGCAAGNRRGSLPTSS